jgi:hypothetical protein
MLSAVSLTPIPIPVPVEIVRDWLDFALLAITLLGVLATTAIGFFTYRATVKANEANARAIELQVTALARVAERDLGQSPGSASGIRWAIDKVSAHGYELRNAGTANAYDVEISEIGDSADADTDLHTFNAEPIALDPGASIPFSIERRLTSPPVTLVLISWRNSEGEQQHIQRLIR